MITCEHNSCMKELSLADFKRRDVYPCCGKGINQTIVFPEPKKVETPPKVVMDEPVVIEQEVVEEKPKVKAPAKKKTSKAKKTKK